MRHNLYDDIEEVLITREEISKKVKELGDIISRDYEGNEIVVLGVLKGGAIFLADLIRAINLPLEIDFIAVSSYGSSTISSGVVQIIKDISADITGKHVIIVEDIVDTGLTLNYLYETLSAKKPLSVEACAILDKPSRRKIDVQLKYKGFEIPDKFVVGYGLDFDGKYRNVGDVCVLKPDIYKNSLE